MKETMIRLSYLFLLIVLLQSCMLNNGSSKDKLIFAIIGTMCTYDSVGRPQLMLREYIEYNQGIRTKVALGRGDYFKSKNAPSFCLDTFYSLNRNDSIQIFIDKFLKNFNYKNEYPGPGDRFTYLIIYKSRNTVKQILYKIDSLPKGLAILDSYLKNLIHSKGLTPIHSFDVDSLLYDYQGQLFLKHPPPPAPEEMVEKIKW